MQRKWSFETGRTIVRNGPAIRYLVFTVTHCSESEVRHVIHPPLELDSRHRRGIPGDRISAHQPINHVDDFRYASIGLVIMIAKCVTKVLLKIYTPEIAIRNNRDDRHG